MAMTARNSLPPIEVLGKPLPKHLAENIVSAQLSQSLDSVSELTLTMVDPNFSSTRHGYWAERVRVNYMDYKLMVVAVDSEMVGGQEGLTVRCRPAIVQNLKARVGALVMSNVSPSEFVQRETKAAGGLAVVQPLASRAQVSRDVPVQGEAYETDNTPSSWTTFRRLADENGYLLFEQNGVIYFGKPSWLLSSQLPADSIDVWWRDAKKRNVLSMPKCSRSMDAAERTASMTFGKEYAPYLKVGQKLVLRDMPLFSGAYLINSISYSPLGLSGEISVSATTMKDKKPTGVSDDQLKKWANGGDGGLIAGLDNGESTGVDWLDTMLGQLKNSKGFDWESLLQGDGQGHIDNGGRGLGTVLNQPFGTGIAGGLKSVQYATAATIITTTYNLGFSKRAAIIAVATAKQESDLGADPTCYKPNSDYDAGVFQQRVLKGWYGTLAQVNDVTYGTTVFLKGKKLTAADVAGAPNPAGPVGYTIPGLAQIKGWESMSLTRAAQAVQRSAFPNAYAKWEPLATALVEQYINMARQLAARGDTNVSVGKSKFTDKNVVSTPFGRKGRLWSLGWHTGTDFSAGTGAACYAPVSGKIISGNWGASFGRHVILEVAGGIRMAFCHLQRAVVSPGQSVKAGQVLGYCDSTGNVTGPHLHVECRKSPYRFGTDALDVWKWYQAIQAPARNESGNAAMPSKSVQEFVKNVKAQIGKRYVYGAEASVSNSNPGSFDCSELTQWAAGRCGIYLPETVHQQEAHCRAKRTNIPVSQAVNTYGALLFRLKGSPHVEVSLGNGRSVGAVSSSYGIREMSAINRGFDRGGLVPGLLGYRSDLIGGLDR